MSSPTVTVVTPTHQRRESLARVLEGLARQDCPEGFFSVVVVCDGCTDGTPQMLRRTSYPFPIQVIELRDSCGPAAARNQALRVVTAPVILFLDDDVVPASRLVRVHAERHAGHHDLVVIGPLLPPAERQQPWITWEAETLRRQYEEMASLRWAPSPRQFYTGNASVRRDQVVRAGGFNPAFRRNEDVDLALRLQRHGLRFVFEPSAGATHYARRSFGTWARAAREYGRTEVAFGPVWGSRRLVDVKADEFQARHPLVRRVVLAGLSMQQWIPMLVGLGRVAGRVLSWSRLWPLARGAYTSVFELEYWSGVDSALSRPERAFDLLDIRRRSTRARGAPASR